MKKTQMALAAVALVASTAAMAEVTIGGRFDIGYMSGSGSADLNGSTGGTPNRALNTGLLAPNFLNFSGSDDLGNGMKATFMLSNIINSSGFGTLSYKTAQSNVGLSGDFGAIKLGQMVDSFWGAGVANFDVTGGANIGSSVSAVFAHGASGVFHDNSIQYSTPSISGINAQATYAVTDGTSAGTSQKQGDYSLAATADISSVKIGAGYSVLSTNKSYFVGAGSDLGFAKVNVVYIDSNAVAGVAGKAATTMGANAEIPLVGALSTRVGYYSTDGTTINGTNTHATLLYALSKQTSVFGNYEKATGNVKLGGGNGGYGTAGDIVTLGVATSF